MDKLITALCSGNHPRSTLSDIRDFIRKNGRDMITPDQIDIFYDMLPVYLKDEDAKTRKNAAQLIGDLGMDDLFDDLVQAYEKEDTLFVKAAMAESFKGLDYRPALDSFKARVSEIEGMKIMPADLKHLNGEISVLREMIMRIETPKKHALKRQQPLSTVLLVTSPGFEAITAARIPERIQKKAIAGGVMAITDRPDQLLRIRTVKTLMFKWLKGPLTETEPKALAQAMVRNRIVPYLEERLSGAGPFLFRIDAKTHHVLQDKSKFVKRLAAEIEAASDGSLQNSASNYEIELRIIENKNGSYSIFLILSALRDTRFVYRKQTLATSLHPVRAAEMVALVRNHTTSASRILDPFCGTGTLLIERMIGDSGCHGFGVDLFGDAIKLAGENAQAANLKIDLVTRDFADFEATKPFDEIITELPQLSERMTKEKLEKLYHDFIRKCWKWLVPGGLVSVLASEPAFLMKELKEDYRIRILDVVDVSGKGGRKIIIFRMGEEA